MPHSSTLIRIKERYKDLKIKVTAQVIKYQISFLVKCRMHQCCTNVLIIGKTSTSPGLTRNSLHVYIKGLFLHTCLCHRLSKIQLINTTTLIFPSLFIQLTALLLLEFCPRLLYDVDSERLHSTNVTSP